MGDVTEVDDKWLAALAPYVGGGIVPYFKQSDGSIDADRTLESFAKLQGFTKKGQNGKSIPWP